VAYVRPDMEDELLGREVGGGAEQQRDTCRAWFGGRSRIRVCMPMSRRETGTARGQEARASSAAARAQWWTPRMVTSGSWVQSPSRPRVSTLVRAAALVQPRRAKTSRRVSSGRALRKSPASAFCGCAIGMAPSKISEDRGCVCEPTNIYTRNGAENDSCSHNTKLHALARGLQQSNARPGAVSKASV
jgi:hypothetical protein